MNNQTITKVLLLHETKLFGYSKMFTIFEKSQTLRFAKNNPWYISFTCADFRSCKIYLRPEPIPDFATAHFNLTLHL
jgi:hypothetical protein